MDAWYITVSKAEGKRKKTTTKQAELFSTVPLAATFGRQLAVQACHTPFLRWLYTFWLASLTYWPSQLHTVNTTLDTCTSIRFYAIWCSLRQSDNSGTSHFSEKKIIMFCWRLLLYAIYSAKRKMCLRPMADVPTTHKNFLVGFPPKLVVHAEEELMKFVLSDEEVKIRRICIVSRAPEIPAYPSTESASLTGEVKAIKHTSKRLPVFFSFSPV